MRDEPERRSYVGVWWGLSDYQREQFQAFKKDHSHGGSYDCVHTSTFNWKVTDTGIGEIIYVVCDCGEEVYLEHETWRDGEW